MPTLKGTEVSLSYVQCFSYLSPVILYGWIPSGQTSHTSSPEGRVMDLREREEVGEKGVERKREREGERLR